MSAHKHQTILLGAAQELLRAGRIETFDAVYNWVCPECSQPQRTTRLADTVYALRHAYGWLIETEQEGTNLSAYLLVKAGDMPGDASKGPHPRRLVGEVKPQNAVGYRNYIGKPVPVSAVPNPFKWRCGVCHFVIDKPLGQPMLGGYRQVDCPRCQKRRVFTPV